VCGRGELRALSIKGNRDSNRGIVAVHNSIPSTVKTYSTASTSIRKDSTLSNI